VARSSTVPAQPLLRMTTLRTGGGAALGTAGIAGETVVNFAPGRLQQRSRRHRWNQLMAI